MKSDSFFQSDLRPVTLTQVLQDREDRVDLQQTLLRRHGRPLISFTLNIAGPIKRTPLIERSFREGLCFLNRQLGTDTILHQEIKVADTGCLAIYCVALPAETLKDICIKIEEATPLGRLFDMDVIDADGHKLDRDPSVRDSRGCIVCGAPGRACAAGRLHSVEELQTATDQIMTEYFWFKDIEHISDLAVQSLIDEVRTTPKPGLVDLRNNGSHQDMTVSTFLSSAESLRTYFEECLKIGQNTQPLPPADTFPALRRAGLQAEQTMYAATGGINTHKGIIYTMGILCGALGRMWTPENPFPAALKSLLSLCSQIAAPSVQADFAAYQESPSTAGLRLFSEQGITGVRGEVASGLPSVGELALPFYQKALRDGLSSNDAGAVTLLYLITRVKDTNLYHRGGTKGALFAAQAANELLMNPNTTSGYPSMEQIRTLDDAFIERNLSPGGCADLLAVTIFLEKLS